MADPSTVHLGLAVTRGLLPDLVATGDDDGVDAAVACFVALLRHRVAGGDQPSDRSSSMNAEDVIGSENIG